MNELYFSCFSSSLPSPEAVIQQLRRDFLRSLEEAEYDLSSVMFIRFFCSDVYTQMPMLEKTWADIPCQRIFIGQTPLDSSHVSLQVYCLRNAVKKSLDEDGSLLVQHGPYQSLWTLDYPSLPAAPTTSCAQANTVIASFQKKLRRYGMTLQDHALRTWYYVRDIDNNYAGMIKSRLVHYEACGLTQHTHFIASTGIEACAHRPDVLTWLHAHAERGLQPDQITYLKALDHLAPTSTYGVNFERATRVVYGDRMHGHISGTASIDHEGVVLHKGNVVRQFERAVENVDALLREGDMSLQQLKAATIYLRDSCDYPRIAPLAKALLPPDCAVNITRGPVCRPDWLVEIEGEAIAPHCSCFPAFL